ncbi:hypothetical protein D3C75_1103350 [compost metagenome]
MAIGTGKLIDDAGGQWRGIARASHIAKVADIIPNFWQCGDWNTKNPAQFLIPLQGVNIEQRSPGG